jgi:hypothetical protein
VKEYARVVCALALNTLAAPSNETMAILHLFHPLAEVDLPSFVDDFHLKIEITLKYETFVSTLVCSLHLSSNGP